MKRDSLVLVAAVFVILASFFAGMGFYSDDLISGSVITGAAVLSGGCEDDEIIFKVSDSVNGHAGLWNETNYSYDVCVPGKRGSRDCDGNNTIIKLAQVVNSHVGIEGNTTYSTPVCFENFLCGAKDACDVQEMCIVSVSNMTNAHVADCGVYPLQVCCKSTFIDSDNDGIPDTKDNCPNIANGPWKGTCVGSNNLCTSDADCSGSYCSNGNENQDGDNFGDACDTGVNDPCVPVGCGVASLSCLQSLYAYWGSTKVSEGEQASLVVTGDSTCEGFGFMFSVFDKEDLYKAVVIPVDPVPAQFSGGYAGSNWIAEYHEEGLSNEYGFIASTLSSSVNGSSISVASNNLLPVDKAADPVCGNGAKETSNFEECDDNNTISGDGCSGACILEGKKSGNECGDEGACVYWQQIVCSDDQESYGVCVDTDGNRCLELKNRFNCKASEVCSDIYQTCVPEVCEKTWKCDDFGVCENGKKTRSCFKVASNPLCDTLKPVDTVPCVVEESEEFSFFGWWQFIIAGMIIVGYSIIRTIRKK